MTHALNRKSFEAKQLCEKQIKTSVTLQSFVHSYIIKYKMYTLFFFHLNVKCF